MKNALNYLAYNSYLVIKIIFSLSFLTLIILHYFVLDSLPSWILYSFSLISGIFIGYSIAYYSIKHLQLGKKDKYSEN